jgi:hypothetical protein
MSCGYLDLVSLHPLTFDLKRFLTLRFEGGREILGI